MPLIIGGTSKCLQLATTMENPIDNEQVLEISPFEFGLCQQFDEQYGDTIKRRGLPSPIYNCHGLTFASRRTGVFENTVLERILEDDRYEEIESRSVLPGDIILYYGDDGDIEHSGIVLEPPTLENLNVPRVVSKWGKYSEIIHLANNCPYSFANAKYYRINHGEYRPT